MKQMCGTLPKPAATVPASVHPKSPGGMGDRVRNTLPIAHTNESF